MLRKTTHTAAKLTASIKLNGIPVQKCIETCDCRCWLYCKKGHRELEQAIVDGNATKTKALLAAKWVNFKQRNSDGLTLQDLAELHASPKIIALFKEATK